METMYPGMVNSPATTLSEAFTADDDHIHVTELAVFPAGPNIAVIGSGTDACTYAYTGKSAASGSGTLTGVSDIEGTDKNWDSGEVIARNFTNFDLVTVQDNVTELGTNCPRVSTGDTTVYVDKAATGTGDGTSWTNAFTTIQAAIDSLPAAIIHEIAIIIRKGSSAYNENLTVPRIIAGGNVAFVGEYYWSGVNNGSSGAGTFDLDEDDDMYADRAQIAAGDHVHLTVWSGTPYESAPSGSYEDTVASVSGAEITLTTNTGIEPTSSWTYLIVKTELIAAEDQVFAFSNDSGAQFYVSGLYLETTDSNYVVEIWGAQLELNRSFLKGSGGVIRAWNRSALFINVSYLTSSANSKFAVELNQSSLLSEGMILNMTGSSTYGMYITRNSEFAGSYNGIAAATTGIRSRINSGVEFYTGWNNGTTPINPTGSSDYSYIVTS